MPTGTQMLALARIRAQDADTANPAVSDAQALSLLNDIRTSHVPQNAVGYPYSRS